MRYVMVIGGLLGLAACQAPTTPTGADFREVPADMIMVGMTQQMTDAGVRRATLKGDTAFIFDDSAKVKVHKVDLVMFDPLGKQTAHLTSRTGDFNTSTQGMIARGGVILIAGTRRIETEELYYDPQTKRLWSNVKTAMFENGTRSTGDGFTSDDQFQNVTVKNPKGKVTGLKIEF